MARPKHRTEPGGTYFVTTNTWERRAMFRKPEWADIVERKVFEHREKGEYLVSCNRSSQHKSAPKERHNLAHGVKPWVGAPSLSPFPSPARPAAQSAVPVGLRAQVLRAAGRRERGAEGGVRATLSPGLRPGLRYFAPSGLRPLHFRAPDLVDELLTLLTRSHLQRIELKDHRTGLSAVRDSLQRTDFRVADSTGIATPPACEPWTPVDRHVR